MHLNASQILMCDSADNQFRKTYSNKLVMKFNIQRLYSVALESGT
jgi:hypothetical protein